jgi:hypothetical protein
MRPKLILIFFLFLNQIQAQKKNEQDTIRQNYLAELKIIGKIFTDDFYPNYAKTYSLPEKFFVAKIDLVRNKFNAVLNSYKSKFDIKYIQEQEIEIKYYFDKLLIEFPLNHDIYIGKTSQTLSTIPQKLKANLSDFNKVELLANSDFTNYVKAFLSYKI